MLANPLFVVAVALVVGLCVGSFLNVVVHRLPKMMERDWRAQCAELRDEPPPSEDPPAYNLAVPRSACPDCGHPIGALENIPIVSYLLQRGACKACRKPISVRYPLVEALGGLLAAYAIWRFGLTWKGGAACVFLWMLIALTFIDFDTQLLPDNLTLPLLWAGLVANVFGLFVSLQDAVLGAIAGYLALWIVYWLFRLIRGKEGMFERTSTSMSLCCAMKRPSRGSNQRAANEGVTLTRSCRGLLRWLASRNASSISASAPRNRAASRSPSSVNRMPRPARSIRRTFSAASSALIW